MRAGAFGGAGALVLPGRCVSWVWSGSVALCRERLYLTRNTWPRVSANMMVQKYKGLGLSHTMVQEYKAWSLSKYSVSGIQRLSILPTLLAPLYYPFLVRR